MIQVTVWLHTDEFIFVWFYKNENGRHNSSRAPKLGYFDGRAPQLSARVNHGTPAAGVIGHIVFEWTFLYFILFFISFLHYLPVRFHFEGENLSIRTI